MDSSMYEDPRQGSCLAMCTLCSFLDYGLEAEDQNRHTMLA